MDIFSIFNIFITPEAGLIIAAVMSLMEFVMPSYFIATCGEVKIEILKKYIENQGNAFTPPKQSLEGACT